LPAEQRLKAGTLKAMVATASLELGIDIGDVELVCQLGTPRAICTFLQRVGRANHGVGGVPKGRLFPLSRDELVECTALLDAVREGEIAGEMVMAYPPGIPVLCIGERITKDEIDYIKMLKREKCELQGASDKNLEYIRVLDGVI
jgi:superfamily II DNA/RNA helicase